MDDLGRFFDATDSIRAEADQGQARFRAVGDTNGFVRWGSPEAGFIPLAPDRDVLELEIADLGQRGKLQIRLEFVDGDGKSLGGGTWFKRLRQPGIVALPSVRAFAREQGVEGAAGFRVFFRLPRNRSMTLNEIRVLDRPTAAALPYIQLLELKKLQIEIDTGQSIPVVDAHSATVTDPTLTLRNTSEQTLEVAAELSAISFLGQSGAVDHPDTIRLAPGESWSTTLPLGDYSYDGWTLHYTFKRGEIERRGESHYALMPFNGVEPQSLGGFYYAINGARFEQSEAELRKTIQAQVALGVTHIRGGLTWNTIQPQPEAWRWEKFDRSITMYAQAGIEPQILLSYSARWAVDEKLRDAHDPTQWMFAPPDLDAWSRYVSEAARRYADVVTYWEVWNEPDLTNFWKGDTRQYIDLLRASYRAVHDNDPDAQVMTGGFATLMPHGGRKHFNLMRDVMREANDAFDVVAFHQHGTFDGFADIVDHELVDVLGELPEPRPLYFNETAIGRGKGYTYQAESVAKKIAFTRSRGAIGHAWFTLVSGETFPWGIMIRDHEPLPAYVAYNALIRELGQLDFVRELDLGEGNIALLFGDERRSLLIFWSQSKDASRGLATLHVKQNRESVRQLDLMGNPHPVEGPGDRVVVAIGPRPSYLAVPAPAAAIEVERRVVSVEGPTVVYGDAPAQTIANLYNPFDETITVTLASHNAETTTHEVAPQAGVAVPITVAAPAADKSMRYGERFEHPLSVSVEPLGLKHTLTVPVMAGALISATPGFEPPPDFVVNDRPQVRNLFAFDPQSSDKVWGGPRDLSVQGWLGADEQALTIRLHVRDDVHQPGLPNNPTAGDSLTLLIAPNPGEPKNRVIINVTASGDDVVSTEIIETIEGWDRNSSTSRIERHSDNYTIYTTRIKLDALGRSRAQLTDGIGLNFAVHDSDLGVREGWAEIAPGMDRLSQDGGAQVVTVRFEPVADTAP